MTGKNTPSAALLRSFVDRVERVNAEIKALSEDRTAIFGEAKSAGYNTPAMRRAIKRRTYKPHDLQEADAMDDLYRHSLGMDSEPPLFRNIAAMAKDIAGGDKLLEAFKLLVPPGSEVTIAIAGKKVRLWRDKDGEPMSEDYVEPGEAKKSHSRTTLPPAEKKDVPNCTEDEAEQLGVDASKANEPVIKNPFPHDDGRRPRWDLGWRKGMGNDGLEPDDE